MVQMQRQIIWKEMGWGAGGGCLPAGLQLKLRVFGEGDSDGITQAIHE